LTNRRTAAAAALILLLFGSSVLRAEDRATILWKGESHPLGTIGGKEFVVSDAARALGFTVAADPGTNVLTLTGQGHQILIGPGTAQVPVDRRVVPISAPARLVLGSLYAPADFFEKILFPLAGASGAWDAAKRIWTLSPAGPPPLAIDVAVVHVAPTTQVVLRLSAPAKTTTTATDKSYQVRFADTRIDPPFPEKKFDDPLVSAVRFAGDTATVDFREPNLSARSYPLTSPDRIVIEVGRRTAAAEAPPAPPGTAPAVGTPPLTIAIDPGHGGTETGAIGPGGLQEKEVTLEIAKRVAAALPKVLACRTVLTRDADVVVSFDDRTSIANHEKADLFLSIHANSSRAASAKGSETYYLSLEASDKIAQEVAKEENQSAAAAPTPGEGSANPALDFVLWDMAQSAHLKESSELAEAIQTELNGVSDTGNRGIKQAPFRVLVGATMPAVLVEVAFISNPEEEKKLKSPEFQQAVADAVARAVAHFFSRRVPGAARPAAAATPLAP
jgi:N-acetylmuramoyl-L-alanine amidase